MAHHFQIIAPDGWYTWKDLDTGDGIIDVLMRGSADNGTPGPVGGSIAVTSEARQLSGSADEAAAILQEGLDNISATSFGFRVVEPASRLTVGGNAAAKAVFMVQPSTYDVYTILLVVTSAGWDRFWAIAGGVFSWDAPTISPVVNTSLASFTVTPPPSPPDGPVATTGPWSWWLLMGGLVATAIEGGVLGVLVVRHRRRMR